MAETEATATIQDAAPTVDVPIAEALAARKYDATPFDFDPLVLEGAKEETPEEEETPAEEETNDSPTQKNDEVLNLLKSMQAEIAELRKGKEPAPVPIKKIEDEDLVTDGDFNTLFGEDGVNRNALNKMLQRSAALGYERAMLKIPEVASQVAGQAMTFFMAQEDYFRSGNEDLRAHRKLLGNIARELNAQQPELFGSGDYLKGFQEAGKKLRAVQGATTKTDATKKKPPVVPSPNGTRTVGNQNVPRPSMADDIMRMRKAAGALG